MGARFHSRAPGFPAASIAVAFSLAACSTTRVVKSGEAFEWGGPSTLSSGKTAVKIRDARLVGDTLFAREPVSGREFGLPVSQVDSVVARGGAWSVGEGLKRGVLAGLAIGGVLDIVFTTSGAYSPEQCGSPCIGGPGMMTVMGGIGGLIYGPTLVAWTLSRTYVFASLPPDTSIVSESVPADSVRVVTETPLPTEELPVATTSPALAAPTAPPAAGSVEAFPSGDSLMRWQRTLRDSLKANPSRGRLYFGGGLSAGFGAVPSGPHGAAPRRASDGGPGMEFAAGATLNPRWLVGVRYAATGYEQPYDGENGKQELRNALVTAFMAESFWFPRGRGFFVQAGIGRASYDYSEYWNGPIVHSGSGPVVAAGVGYAFWLGRSFNVTFGAEAVRPWYSDGAGGLALKPSVGLYWF